MSETETREDPSIREVLEQVYADAGDDVDPTHVLADLDAPLPAEPEAKDEPEVTQEAAAEAPAATEEPAAVEATEAPAHWSLEDRDMFTKQEPAAQQWLLGRSKAMEAAHTKRSQEIAPVRELTERWKPYMDQNGGVQAIDNALQAEQVLQTGSNDDKIYMLRQMIRHYGVSIPGVDQSQGNEAQPAASDPRIDNMEREMVSYRQAAEAQQQQQAAAHVEQLQRHVNDFAESKDEQGKLHHPHFGEVRRTMSAMAQAKEQAGEQPNLDQIYEAAVWATPSTRAKLIESQRTSALDQARADAAKARNAAGSVSGAGSPPTEQPGTVRQELERQFSRL